MSNPSHINFAKLSGIDSVPAAAVFAALYSLLFGWFIVQSFRKPTDVFFSLAFFCAVRISAFVIRALLAANESAGETFGLLLAEEVLFGAGFLGLLFSAYNLVLDRELISGHPRPRSRILHLTRNRLLYRIGLSAAVALAIAGISMTHPDPTRNANTIKALHAASTAIFFILTLLQVFQTFLLAQMEITGKRDYSDKTSRKVGTRNALYILFLISALILIREAFSIATVNNAEKQNNEHFWYPFIALPEILAVVLYTTRGLVPARSELPKDVNVGTNDKHDTHV